jgi:hypothetical protein
MIESAAKTSPEMIRTANIKPNVPLVRSMASDKRIRPRALGIQQTCRYGAPHSVNG